MNSGRGLEVSGFESGEVCGRGAGEALFTVNGGVDLFIRKNEPILRGDVLQPFRFTELEERGGFASLLPPSFRGAR
jgi:hypothetical protein